ncbi:hypothetical protein EDC94DRAFT_621123 [Helicostylum pulchrum]|uniref:Uncharacterized protein n=1 Tax=Helicostylum pulchrum TaxID=562976 RepID=A0ABP9Y3G5_9FUNG|nr:hypothetical protein EDC94DRAFT_621123 [Helicostylum pulchrum]
MKEIEILLETSSFFGCTNNVKKGFDHHKGHFGILAMIADTYYLGSIDTFTNIKILFVHASGTTLYVWSIRYVKDGPIYELWLKGCLNIQPKFEDKTEMLPETVKFYWMIKVKYK